MEKSKNQLYTSIEQALIGLNATKQSLLEQLSLYFKSGTDKNITSSQKNNYENQTDSLLCLLASNCSVTNIPKYTELVNNFEQLRTFINNHKEKVILEQTKERFQTQPDDSFFLKIRKIRKRFLLKLQWSGISLTNLFRKVKRPRKYWKHKVKEQDLAQYIFHFKFHKYLLPHFKDFLQNRFELLLKLNEFDNRYEKVILNAQASETPNEFNVQEFSILLNELSSRLKSGINALEKSLRSEFKQSRYLAGTIELPTSKYKSSRINGKTNKVLRKYQHLLRNHHIAGQAVMEYWLFEAGIRASVLDIERVVQEAIEVFREKVDTNLMPEVTTIISGLNKSISLIRNITGDAGSYNNLSKQIATIKSTIKGMLDRTAKGDLIEIYQTFFPSMMRSLHRVPETSRFSGRVFKAKTIAKKYSLKPVNGRQILEGILINSVQDDITEEGKKLQQKILILLNDLEEILEVIDVSYDYYGPKGDSFPKEDRKEFEESLKRAVIKAEEFKTDLQNLVNSTKVLFQHINRRFQDEIMISLEPGELIMTDRKLKLKSLWRLFHQNFTRNLKLLINLTPRALRWLKDTISSIKNKYFNLRSLLGISEQKEVLSSDISNYLAETEKAITRLPQIYQRLFHIAPLKDERFYVKREKAYSEVETAFSNWKDQKFAPACLVGEQGSGATTLINFFEKELSNTYRIVRIDLNARYLTETDFSNLLKKLFPGEDISNADDLISKVNDKGPHAIIILENIQHLFIRRTNGFNTLNKIFKLISQTNSSTFWLCTCLQYSWKYLDNTHYISDYFAHVINLENLSIETLTEAIIRRHRPSGFEMVFLPSDEHQKKRFFLRNRNIDRQSTLQNEFFNSLKEYTKGNLSFAFLLWLRSVVKIEDNTIYFKFRKLNLGFLRSLEVKKITSLYSILIHSGLTCEEHSEIFGTSVTESFIHLMVMTDDGMLVRKENKYILNPLLFRHIVSHLESANFIH